MQDSKQDSKRDEYLGQFDERTQVRILQILADSGIKKNDPIFSSLLYLTGVKETLERGPGEIRQAVDYGLRQFLEVMEESKQVAAMTTEKRIASAVNALLQKTNESKSRVTIQSVIWAGVIIFSAFVIGWASCNWYRVFRQPQVALDPSGPRTLTVEEVKNLDWSMSAEGKKARQIVALNPDVMGGECEEQARAHNITIQIGDRRATSGYCVLWVQPPGERTFEAIKSR